LRIIFRTPLERAELMIVHNKPHSYKTLAVDGNAVLGHRSCNNHQNKVTNTTCLPKIHLHSLMLGCLQIQLNKFPRHIMTKFWKIIMSL